MKNKNLLTHGPILRHLITLTVPMVGGLLATMSFNLIDTYFVSRLGTNALAAISFTFPIVFLIFSLAIGIGIGTSSVIARRIGEGNHEKVKQITTDSILLSIGISIIVSVCGLCTIRPLFSLLGATPDLIPAIRDYMTVWYLGMPFLVLPIVGNNALRATGNALYPSLIMITAALLNAILDPILIFGLWGFPRLELFGAALASVIGRSVTCFISLGLLCFHEHMISFARPRIKELLRSWEEILFIAFPSALSNILFPISMAYIMRLAAEHGPAAVAACGTGSRIDGFAMVIVIALTTALIPFIGQNWGARHFDRVHEARVLSFRFAIYWGAICAILFGLVGKPIAEIFSSDPSVVTAIRWYLVIVPLGYGMRGISVLTADIFYALNKPYTSAILCFTRWFIFIIPCVTVGNYFFGVIGLFIGLSAGMILAGGSAYIWTLRVCRTLRLQRKKLVPQPAPIINGLQ